MSVDVPAEQTITEALLKVSTLLAATSGSLDIVCARVEAATSRASLRGAFRQFNEGMAMLREATPGDTEEHEILEVFEALPLSRQFKDLLLQHSSLADSISTYKSLVI